MSDIREAIETAAFGYFGEEPPTELVEDLVHSVRQLFKPLVDAEHSVEHLYEHEALRYTGVVMSDDLRAALK